MRVTRSSRITTHLAAGLCALALLAPAGPVEATPTSTDFTYQGLLKNAGVNVNEDIDVRCRLFDAGTGGTQIGAQVEIFNVAVTDGVFAVDLDFGSAFDGSARWLEFEVKLSTEDPSAYETLLPRQEVKPTPFSLYSLSTGQVPSSSFFGTYAQEVSLTNSNNAFAGSFIGNGAGLINLDPASISAGTINTALNLTNLSNTYAGDGAGLFNIGWDNLTDIPPGFADGVDDTGPWSLSGANAYYTAGRVGIGVNNPSSRLHINGALNQTPFRVQIDGLTKLLVTESGGVSVGANTQAPTNGLYVQGNIGLGTSTPSKRIAIVDPGMGFDRPSSNNLAIFTSNTERVRINEVGNVGIGTTNPGAAMHIRNGSSGAAPFVNTNLVVESNGSNFQSMMAPDGSTQGLVFVNPDSVGFDAGMVFDLFDSDSLSFYTGGSPRLLINGTGNVGIGTTNPLTNLHIGPSSGSAGAFMIGAGQPEGINFGVGGNGLAIGKLDADGSNYQGLARLTFDGKFGVGTTNPITKFHLNDGSLWIGGTHFGGLPASAGAGIRIFNNSSGSMSPTIMAYDYATATGLDIHMGHPGTKVSVPVLEIRGGADIVEGFDTSCGTTLEPGTVVVIDPSPENAGSLMQSTEVYDFKVAGVVSGANGVQPGIHLGQESVMDGDTKVAMTGRVYVKCSTENGAIRPGDLLTTASLAGHAMKATDRSRSHGTVIGKAMSSLDEDAGLVLVLVNLQ